MATVHSYKTKIDLLQSSLQTKDIDDTKDSDKVENLHSKYCSLYLKINKFANNNAVRAELDHFPLKLNVLKHWYRLESTTAKELMKRMKFANKTTINSTQVFINSISKNGLSLPSGRD